MRTWRSTARRLATGGACGAAAITLLAGTAGASCDSRATGTGTFTITGSPASVEPTPTGGLIVHDLPVAGTVQLTSGAKSITGTFTGADTITSTAQAVTKVRGHRSYQLGDLGTCEGDVKGNKFGAGNAAINMTEKLRCDSGARVTLTVNDVSPILVNGQFVGWNRTVEARIQTRD